MADINPVSTSSFPSSSVSNASRQQAAGYARPVMVAPPAARVRLLRLPEVMNRIGLCRASIYAHMAAGTFPKQIALGVRAVGWLESEIEAWIAQRILKRR